MNQSNEETIPKENTQNITEETCTELPQSTIPKPETQISTENDKNNVNKKKTRCKNWPNCNDPNCIYTHPTETV